MKGITKFRQGLLALAVTMTTALLYAEVVTWSGEAQSVSANTEIEALHVTAATTVTIAGGCSLTVGELIGDAAITKAGDGTLVVRSFSANSQITATAGSVRFAAGGPTDTTVFDTVNTFYHVDASVASTRTAAGADAEGRTLVSALADIRGAGYPTSSAGVNKPWIDGGALNGRDVLDFGSFAYGTVIAGYGAFLNWSAGSTGVREVLLVYSDAPGTHDQFFLGAPNAYHYHRGADGTLFNGTYSSASVRNGTIYVDGETRAVSYALPAGFHVIRLVQAGVTTVSTFGNDRNTALGGMRLAEAIVLNANLDAVSSRRLEMRLQEKWLPEARTLANLTLTGAANLTVDEGVKFRVLGGSLEATATVTGEGEAQFQVSEGVYSYPAKSIVKVTESQRAIWATAARSVKVEAGTLSILTTASKLTPALHLDAAAEGTATISDGAGGHVQYWNDVRGQSFGQALQYTLTQQPIRQTSGQNALPIVDFGKIYISTRWPAENAPANMGMTVEVTGIRDAFMVVADSDDTWKARDDEKLDVAPFFLCHKDAYDFHRGGNASLLHLQYGCGKDAGTTAAIDGVGCAKDAALPRGFHLVRISPAKDSKMNQLCKDRGGNFYGGLKYGEIMLFKGAKLSDADAADVTQYLLNKWGLPNATGAGVAYDSLEIAAGATLGLPNGSTTSALDGAGTVQGDLTLEEGFSLKVTAGEPLTVTGKLTLPATGTVVISGNVKDFDRDAVVTLVSAGSTVVAENPTWTVTGSFTDSRRTIEVFADAEGLKAKIVPQGLSVIIR